jgi:hypothetical protein
VRLNHASRLPRETRFARPGDRRAANIGDFAHFARRQLGDLGISRRRIERLQFSELGKALRWTTHAGPPQLSFRLQARYGKVPIIAP